MKIIAEFRPYSTMHKTSAILMALFLSSVCLQFALITPVAAKNKEKLVEILKGFKYMSKESAECVSCHREKTPGIYEMWVHPNIIVPMLAVMNVTRPGHRTKMRSSTRISSFR